jgi:hypothetical protein
VRHQPSRCSDPGVRMAFSSDRLLLRRHASGLRAPIPRNSAKLSPVSSTGVAIACGWVSSRPIRPQYRVAGRAGLPSRCRGHERLGSRWACRRRPSLRARAGAASGASVGGPDPVARPRPPAPGPLPAPGLASRAGALGQREWLVVAGVVATAKRATPTRRQPRGAGGLDRPVPGRGGCGTPPGWQRRSSARGRPGALPVPRPLAGGRPREPAPSPVASGRASPGQLPRRQFPRFVVDEGRSWAAVCASPSMAERMRAPRSCGRR